MRTVDLIQKKKEGKKHTKEEIYFLVNGYTKGEVEDYQMSAWLMAVCFCGLDKEEIISTAEYIGTYPISILPYEDCCVLFSPRHPVLRAKISDAHALYNKLEADDLIMDAFNKREIKRFSARDYISQHFSS